MSESHREGYCVRKQHEPRRGTVEQRCVFWGRGGLEAGRCYQSREYSGDYRAQVQGGSGALTAVLMSFDFIPRAMRNH